MENYGGVLALHNSVSLGSEFLLAASCERWKKGAGKMWQKKMLHNIKNFSRS